MSKQGPGISDLMQGALHLLSEKPLAVGAFILADLLSSYSILWAEARYELGLAFLMIAGFGVYSVLCSGLILVLGRGLHEALRDPAELLVRWVFVFAAGLLVLAGAGLGLVLLILPGLYLLARWTIVLPLILLDGAGIGEAFGRSWHLTQRSAWSLAAISLIILVPELLLGFAGSNEVGAKFLHPPFRLLLEFAAGSCILAFEIGVAVIAYRELSPRPDQQAGSLA